MRGTWRVAVLAAALTTVGLGVAADAASPGGSGVLVLSGRGGTFAEITLSRTVSVVPMHLAEAKDEDGNQLHPDGWSWTGCGRVRGFYLRPLTGNPLSGVGAVDFADLRYTPTDLPLPGGPIPRLPIPLGLRHLDQAKNRGQNVPNATAIVLRPGRYRVFLLGEGSCQVRVPLGGPGRTLRVTATRPATMHAQVSAAPAGDAPAPGVPLARVVAVKVPVTVRPNTVAFAFLHRVSYMVATSDTSYGTCVEASDLPTCSMSTPLTPLPSKYGEYHHGASAQPPPGATLPFVSSSVTQIGTWYAPGWLPSGPAYAKVNAESYQTTSLQAVTFALDL